MNFALSIAQRLKEERNRLKLSQQKLAALAGVTRQTQSKYEKGERHPDALYLHTLSQHHCDVNYILTGNRGHAHPLNTAAIIADAPADYVNTSHQHAYDNPKAIMEANDYIMLTILNKPKSAQAMCFQQHWLTQQFNYPDTPLSLVTIEDNSMEPTIKLGDTVMISHDPQHLKQDGLFVIKLNDNFVIKRLQHLPNQQIKVSSDNPAYDAFHITIQDRANQSQIIGKVLWVGHKT